LSKRRLFSIFGEDFTPKFEVRFYYATEVVILSTVDVIFLDDKIRKILKK